MKGKEIDALTLISLSLAPEPVAVGRKPLYFNVKKCKNRFPQFRAHTVFPSQVSLRILLTSPNREDKQLVGLRTFVPGCNNFAC